jgi:hypothetical protein
VFSLSRVTLSRRRALALVPVAAILAASALASPVAARQTVDPATLNPPAPDVYTCAATGDGTICVAETSNLYELEPTGVSCDSDAGAFEVLDTGGHDVRATRWYDGEGNLVKRLVVHTFPGTHFTNPLNGVTIDYHQHNTDWDVLAVPGDFSSASWSGHGVLAMTLPGYGRVLLEAGVVKVAPSGEVEHQAGPSDLSDYFEGDASAVTELCAALTEG